MTLDEAIGRVIREARSELSQADLAERLGGWPQKKISLIEQGKQPVSLKELDLIGGALRRDPVSMIRDAFARYRRAVSK